MLHGLDDIPWHELQHAYGSAEDVPLQLRMLLDADPQKRENARTKLAGSVLHQGTRYPASAPIVPFLIELCGSPAVPDRDWALSFWGYLITSSFNVQSRPYWGDGQNIFRGGEVQEAGSVETIAVLHEIYRHSLAGFDQALELLSDIEPAVRGRAAWLLACLPTKAEDSLPRLRQRMEVEPEAMVRGAIAFALGELGDVAALDQLLAQEQKSAVRCMAVCELARCTGRENLIDELLSFIVDEVEDYERIPGAGGRSPEDASRSVTYLPGATRLSAIPAIGGRLARSRGRATIPIACALLAAGFEPTETSITELTAVQQDAMRWLVNHQEIWQISNLSGAMRYFGLKRDRQACAAMVGLQVVDDEALSELNTGMNWAEYGDLRRARDRIDAALSLDSAVFTRAPCPAEYWLYYAKAFAETDTARAIEAFNAAIAINPAMVRRVDPAWFLAKLLKTSAAT